MNLITLIFCALATFRLAEMFVIDDGPFEMFVELRGMINRLAFKLPPHSGNLLLGCVHCTGVWIAAIFAIFFTTSILEFIVFWFAVAGLQSVIANKFGRK